jgi:AraC-like DNA-binding protein
VAPREERVAKNEVLFREVNERIQEAARRADFQGPTVFVCECGREDCAEPIELSLEQYERVRAEPTRFAIATSHAIADVERVVEQFDRFMVVEKLELAADIARETDPRT